MQLNEEFYNEQMITGRLFLPIIDLLVESMPRDNLLNSACLEFFEFICLNNLKNVITHLVAEYRDKLSLIDYVSTFKNMIQRFDHAQFQGPNMEGSFMDTEEDTPGRNLPPRNTGTWQGLQDLDPREEDYFNTSDDEDEMPETPTKRPDLNGASPAKPLVDYPSDEENEVPDKENMADKDLDSNVEMPDASSESQNGVETGDNLNSKSPVTPLRQEDQKENESPSPLPPTPPERLSEKRRREEEEDDELSKLASRNKRRSSSSVSQSSPTPGLVKQTIKISTKAKILQ